MSRNVNLNSAEWCEIVFEGKNKQYGAYELRQSSPKRHMIALGVAVTATIIALAIPNFMEIISPEKANNSGYTETTTIVIIPPPAVDDEVIPEIATSPPPTVKEELVNSIKLTEMVITDDDNVKPENEMDTQDKLNEGNTAISTKTITDGTDNPFEGVNPADVFPTTGGGEGTVVTKAPEILEWVPQMPQYPGGEAELLKFIRENYRIPEIVVNNRIDGRFYVKFVINKDGSVSNPVVERSIDPACDKEAIRLVKNLKFIPGKQNGEPVAVYYRIPITIKLEEK